MKMEIEVNGKKYQVTVEDVHTYPISVTVDGEQIEVWLQEEPSAAVVPSAAATGTPAGMPLAERASSGGVIDPTAVIAPIPGVVIEINVSPGDSVVLGQDLCVLEAMKMKNAIRAGKAGVIDHIMVTSGQQVNQGEILMNFKKDS